MEYQRIRNHILQIVINQNIQIVVFRQLWLVHFDLCCFIRWHKPLWNEVNFIDRDPYYYTRRVKEVIYIRLHPDNINRDSGIEIPEAWMPTIKKHNMRAVRRRTAEGANHWLKQHGSKCTNQSCWKTTYHSRASCFQRSRMTSRPHRLKKTNSMQSKRRDLHHTWLHRETKEKLSSYCYSPRWITTTFFTKYR